MVQESASLLMIFEFKKYRKYLGTKIEKKLNIYFLIICCLVDFLFLYNNKKIGAIS
jgi:hypothetical protein